MATLTPWWRTGWVALPVFAAAAAVGAGTAALVAGPAPLPPPLCPDVGPDGGRVEGLDYVERRTEGAEADAPLPMLVLLHGSGMTDHQMAELASGIPVPARLIAPRGFYADAGGGFSWRDAAGQVTLAEDAGSFSNFLEQIRRCRPTRGLPVVAGYDQGADLAYEIAVEDPKLVAAVVGAGGEVPRRLVRAPTVALHGVKDTVASFPRIHNEWQVQISKGAPVRLLRMFGVDHSFAGALQIKLWQESARLLADPSSAPRVT